MLQVPVLWRIRIAIELNSANRSQVAVARQLAPRDTNYMADVSTRVVKIATAYSLKAICEVGAEYGVYVEFGTVNMDAIPFWTPAFKLSRHQLLNRLRKIPRRSLLKLNYGVTKLTNPTTFKSR